jgi:hypothetical protein
MILRILIVDIKLIKMTIMDIDISNSGLTSSVDFLEKYSALHLSNELYESNSILIKNSFDMFPIVMNISARTIAMDLIPVTL